MKLFSILLLAFFGCCIAAERSIYVSDPDIHTPSWELFTLTLQPLRPGFRPVPYATRRLVERSSYDSGRETDLVDLYLVAFQGRLRLAATLAGIFPSRLWKAWIPPALLHEPVTLSRAPGPSCDVPPRTPSMGVRDVY
jgi:hypothetical protein